MTVFPAPLFGLTISRTEQSFVNVDNRLRLTVGDDEVFVPINVNSGLFSVMRLLGVGREEHVTLYLDALTAEGKKFVFGIERDSGDFHDLWTYRADALKYVLRRLEMQRRPMRVRRY